MARLKPAAKGAIIAVVLGIGGFGLNTYLDSRPKTEAPVVQETQPAPAQVQRAEAPVVAPAPTPEPVREAPVAKQEPAPQPAEEPASSNAGLDALLKGRK